MNWFAKGRWEMTISSIRWLVFSFGLPGSGKGQIGRALRKEFFVEWIPISREILKRGYCRKKDYWENENEAILIVDEKIEKNVQGVNLYFDGFPRTDKQLTEIIRIKEKNDFKVALICINLSPDNSLKRCKNRRLCINCLNIIYSGLDKCPVCGGVLLKRKDDYLNNIIKKIQNRILFFNNLKKRSDIFDKIVDIDGTQAIENSVRYIEKSLCLDKRENIIDEDISDVGLLWHVRMENHD